MGSEEDSKKKEKTKHEDFSKPVVTMMHLQAAEPKKGDKKNNGQ